MSLVGVAAMVARSHPSGKANYFKKPIFLINNYQYFKQFKIPANSLQDEFFIEVV
jgi:hypothetical protein